MFQIVVHVSKSGLSSEATRFIDILNRNGMNKLAEALITNSCYHNVPAITYILLKYPSIEMKIKNQKDLDNFHSTDLISCFTQRKNQTIKMPLHIPSFSLLHIGNICHLNSVISLFSSLTELVKELNEIIVSNQVENLNSNQVENLNSNSVENLNQVDNSNSLNSFEIFKLITQYIMNSYSQIDLNPNLLQTLISRLSINPFVFEEATETAKKIIRIFYENSVDKSTIFYWDSSDEFYQSDEPLGEKISHFNSKYLIINVHDMNFLFDIDTDKVKIKNFNIQNSNRTYSLSSIIIYHSNHFITAFNLGNGLFKIIDDMEERYSNSLLDSKTLFAPDNQMSHVLACYLLIN